jgi:hypothetical protein
MPVDVVARGATPRRSRGLEDAKAIGAAHWGARFSPGMAAGDSDRAACGHAITVADWVQISRCYFWPSRRLGRCVLISSEKRRGQTCTYFCTGRMPVEPGESMSPSVEAVVEADVKGVETLQPQTGISRRGC